MYLNVRENARMHEHAHGQQTTVDQRTTHSRISVFKCMPSIWLRPVLDIDKLRAPDHVPLAPSTGCCAHTRTTQHHAPREAATNLVATREPNVESKFWVLLVGGSHDARKFRGHSLACTVVCKHGTVCRATGASALNSCSRATHRAHCCA